jgi:hypothetical protein
MMMLTPMAKMRPKSRRFETKTNGSGMMIRPLRSDRSAASEVEPRWFEQRMCSNRWGDGR